MCMVFKPCTLRISYCKRPARALILVIHNCFLSSLTPLSDNNIGPLKKKCRYVCTHFVSEPSGAIHEQPCACSVTNISFTYRYTGPPTQRFNLIRKLGSSKGIGQLPEVMLTANQRMCFITRFTISVRTICCGALGSTRSEVLGPSQVFPADTFSPERCVQLIPRNMTAFRAPLNVSFLRISLEAFFNQSHCYPSSQAAMKLYSCLKLSRQTPLGKGFSA